MGEVIALIRVMPTEVLNDKQMQKIIDEVKSTIKPPVRLGKVEIKEIVEAMFGAYVAPAGKFKATFPSPAVPSPIVKVPVAP